MPVDKNVMSRHALIRKAAMVAILAPSLLLVGCAQDPAPAAPVQVAPPAPAAAPAAVPRARG